ncbi:hypothetical protein V3C99_014277 [Haemonchus contortus]|uniref:Secreted protein n=1 Tax=Haemonchus contortus TaxID=6289 RepID=A0A7I4YSX0_HAECO
MLHHHDLLRLLLLLVSFHLVRPPSTPPPTPPSFNFPHQIVAPPIGSPPGYHQKLLPIRFHDYLIITNIHRMSFIWLSASSFDGCKPRCAV